MKLHEANGLYCTSCVLSDVESTKRRVRTTFTEEQCTTLEKKFHETHYPDQSSKKRLALYLNIPEDRIMNRRAKWRKQAQERQKRYLNKQNERIEKHSIVYEDTRNEYVIQDAVMRQVSNRFGYNECIGQEQNLPANYPTQSVFYISKCMASRDQQ
uniref:Homeobox domain-containing protein n=1 Tax=Loa loa TaxID=7209 RepID=A0A1I7W101_LOALO